MRVLLLWLMYSCIIIDLSVVLKLFIFILQKVIEASHQICLYQKEVSELNFSYFSIIWEN